jgi:hypothetical protein
VIRLPCFRFERYHHRSSLPRPQSFTDAFLPFFMLNGHWVLNFFFCIRLAHFAGSNSNASPTDPSM